MSSSTRPQSTKSWGALSSSPSTASLRRSTVIPRLTAISDAMVSHIESTMRWYCSLFSGLADDLVYISPADLYLPWRISCTLTPSLSRRSPMKIIWLETPFIIVVAPSWTVM